MTDDLEHRCRRAARAVFARIQDAFPDLRFEIDDPSKNDPVDIDVRVPNQPGLNFDIWMCLQNQDELHLAIGERLWIEWFPCDQPERLEDFYETVCSLLAGRWRIVENLRGNRVVSAWIQRPDHAGWCTVKWSGTMYVPWPWLKKSQRILQGGD